MEARLTFSEPVAVAGGVPRLHVRIAGLPVWVDYRVGSGSATLAFAIEVPAGTRSFSDAMLLADSLTLNGAAIVSRASGLAAELEHDGAEPAPAAGGSNALTAAFHDLPEAHDGSEFTFELRFSEEFPLSFRTLLDHAFGVTGGALARVSRVTSGANSENRAWSVTVNPAASTVDVTMTLAATADCGAAGAICAGGGRALSAAVSATVPGVAPPVSESALTAAFDPVPPAEHDGSEAFEFRVAFSENLYKMSWRTLAEHALSVTQGGASLKPKVSRVHGSDASRKNQVWSVRVTPGSAEPVSITLGASPACGSDGAMCTKDGRKLESGLSATVLGPRAVSVADARVAEGADATVAFAVTLSRAVPGMVASEAAVTRVRLLVEASRSFEAGAGTLTPTLELGVRHDGGDAETGTGVEVGAGLRYAGEGFSVEGSVRALLAHEASGYEERGASGAMRIDPGVSGRGFSLTLAPTWGAASSGVERLWSPEGARSLAPEGGVEAARRLEAEVGYGLGVGGALGVVTPYAGVSFEGGGGGAVRTGARWQIAPQAALGLELTRTESAHRGVEAEHGVGFRLTARW